MQDKIFVTEQARIIVTEPVDTWETVEELLKELREQENTGVE
jgi:PII-like signaling protein